MGRIAYGWRKWFIKKIVNSRRDGRVNRVENFMGPLPRGEEAPGREVFIEVEDNGWGVKVRKVSALIPLCACGVSVAASYLTNRVKAKQNPAIILKE